MAVSDSLIDTLFDGRYRIQRKLGAGGMADVYLAEDQELGRRVAIKILNSRHGNDDQFIERFRREAKNAAALNHPNIVSIYDRGEAEDTYYIAMEFLDGRTLKELIVGRGAAPINVAIEYARQILSALRFAHRHGIVHRDIKPHNVLVDGEGRVKVTDFGIARAGTSQMTETGSIVGTAQYLSPEQAKGGEVDPRSDLYSLGIVLYELLTGKTPFEGDTPVEIAMKHLSTAPKPPSKLRPDIPPELDMVVLRALAKNPDDRYQSADEMEADLDRVARGAARLRRHGRHRHAGSAPTTCGCSSGRGGDGGDHDRGTAPHPHAGRAGGCRRRGGDRGTRRTGTPALALARRRRFRDRRRDRRLLRLSGAGLVDASGARQALRGRATGAGQAADHQREPRRRREERPEHALQAGNRLQAGSGRRHACRQGRNGHDLDVDRSAEGAGAERQGRAVGCCATGAGQRRLETGEVRRPG